MAEESIVAKSIVPLAASFVFAFALSAAAQDIQPTIAAAPPGPEFMSRYDFHLSIARLLPSTDTPAEAASVDQRFAWDGHFGGSFDFADLVNARFGAIVDYQAVMGNERQPFDPNQGNYTLEGFVSARVGADTEVAGIFHHVSRHLSDRPKDFAIAYNELGARLMRRVTFGTTTVDVDLEGGRAIQHSYVDYTWLGEAQVLVRHPVNETVGVFVHGVGQGFLVDDVVAHRGTQAGALVEAGVRVNGRAGVARNFRRLREAGGRRSDRSPVPAMGPRRVPPTQ